MNPWQQGLERVRKRVRGFVVRTCLITSGGGMVGQGGGHGREHFALTDEKLAHRMYLSGNGPGLTCY